MNNHQLCINFDQLPHVVFLYNPDVIVNSTVVNHSSENVDAVFILRSKCPTVYVPHIIDLYSIPEQNNTNIVMLVFLLLNYMTSDAALTTNLIITYFVAVWITCSMSVYYILSHNWSLLYTKKCRLLLGYPGGKTEMASRCIFYQQLSAITIHYINNPNLLLTTYSVVRVRVSCRRKCWNRPLSDCSRSSIASHNCDQQRINTCIDSMERCHD